MNRWKLARTITGLLATHLGCETLKKELLLDGQGLYNWNQLTLRQWISCKPAIACRSEQGKCGIKGEASETVFAQAIFVYGPDDKKNIEVAKLLDSTMEHNGDDLMTLAKDHQVIIYPVTPNGWLFYDGISDTRHKREELLDTDYINRYLRSGTDYQDIIRMEEAASATGMRKEDIEMMFRSTRR